MLGVSWDVEDDLFCFEVPSSTVGVEVATRCQALAVVMKSSLDLFGINSYNALGKMYLELNAAVVMADSRVSLYQI